MREDCIRCLSELHVCDSIFSYFVGVGLGLGTPSVLHWYMIWDSFFLREGGCNR
jgi:hypothetical protein